MQGDLVQLIVGPMLAAGLLSMAAPAGAQKGAIPIWPGAAPGSETWNYQEVVWDNRANPPGMRKCVRNVVRPTLTPYLPRQGCGAAVIICPGGSFMNLEFAKEGTKAAEWLCRRGVAAFVLKYRLIYMGATDKEFGERAQRAFRRRPGGEAPPLPAGEPDTSRAPELAGDDGRQAIRVVRRRAAEWGIDPNRIGIMGFSAGAMVTTDVALRHDAESRPNFVAPIYGPVFGDIIVPDDAAPMFIACADDDAVLASSNSARLYLAWHDAKKPVELHIFGAGGHGFGMEQHGIPASKWIEQFYGWMGALGMLRAERS